MASALEVVREAYEHYCCGRLDPVVDAFADDIRWRSLGPASLIPWAGEYHGREAVRAWFGTVGSRVEIQQYDIKRYIAQDDWVVVLCEVTARFLEAGGSATVEKCDVLQVKDGKIVDFVEFYDSATLQSMLTGDYFSGGR